MFYEDDLALAKYLQQQEDDYLYSDQLYMASSSEGEELSPQKIKKRLVNRNYKLKKSVENNTSRASDSSLNGRDSLKDKKTPRSWSQEEQRLFLEGLELYGRDWEKLAQHVGNNRNKNSCKSHAQKYFIKLYLDQSPLPKKVQESGEGYTLSGKPLDPNSASLKAYSDGSAYRKEIAERNASKRKTVTKKVSSKESLSKTRLNKTRKSEKQLHKEDFISKNVRDEHLPKSAGECRPERSSARLRDSQSKPPDFCLLDPKSHPLQTAVCERYTSLQQPFSVEVSSAALVVMDFHAHLASSEVIGFLGGIFDEQKKVLKVLEAFACRAVDQGDPQSVSHDVETNVEMDPQSELEVRTLIGARNLQIVGWYHSHPTFKPVPSHTDVVNQFNYQLLFYKKATQAPPFIGPYDFVMPREESVITWFNVKSFGSDDKRAMIFEIEVFESEDFDHVSVELRKLVEYYKTFPHRIYNFNQVWRHCQTKVDEAVYEKFNTAIEEGESKFSLVGCRNLHETMPVEKSTAKTDIFAHDEKENLQQNNFQENSSELLLVPRTYLSKLAVSTLSRVTSDSTARNVVLDSLTYLKNSINS
ncbi:histone H2A deubiquitinase MYSM1-like isoform X2 [Zophobas morio]|uniref:histone H2A deubiquitinase MYSM1-like isoform X2 n=1 Tax=Zophobas morio TaxID=2755281 RepID=UPI003082A3FD